MPGSASQVGSFVVKTYEPSGSSSFIVDSTSSAADVLSATPGNLQNVNVDLGSSQANEVTTYTFSVVN